MGEDMQDPYLHQILSEPQSARNISFRRAAARTVIRKEKAREGSKRKKGDMVAFL